MAHYDVFNGDADGICALHQLRLAQPCADAELITGIKREIALLKRVQAVAGDIVTVLDISLDSNRADLERLLHAGAQVLYFDHHYAGDTLFAHPNFNGRIDTSSLVCTSLLVDVWLHGAHRLWAVTAAFGDNLHASARRAAEGLGLSETELTALQTLGECLNYNGYGEQLADLWFHPAELYRAVQPYADPRAFMAEAPAYQKLHSGYLADLDAAEHQTALLENESVAAFQLPDAPWARRVSGILANRLAHAHPTRAHAVLTPVADARYTVSVRAPLSHPAGADALCRQFPNGGGRSAAAGINGLPESDVPQFLQAFAAQFRRQ
ncbi:MAG: acetyltransferase [Burkholderiaceae bacterium]|nr:MAG: acetyltransferase [Burkholderiaceae bacterium]